jgi:hypothetical protein
MNRRPTADQVLLPLVAGRLWSIAEAAFRSLYPLAIHRLL